MVYEIRNDQTTKQTFETNFTLFNSIIVKKKLKL